MAVIMTINIDERKIRAKVRGKPVRAGQTIQSLRDKIRRRERRTFKQTRFQTDWL
jgi:hypothetical protein